MKITTDTKQRIQSLFLFFLEFYKVLMGTYLVVFIPQDCGEHACSLSENIHFNDWKHAALLICNSVAFMVILSFYIIEMKREYWCIEYLDVDHDKPTSNLDDEIEHYPEIKNNMNRLNKHYYNATLASLFVVCANYVVSIIYILPNHYGSSTFTSLASFCILVVMKLYSAWNISYLSIHEEHAYSGYMKTAVTFNVIDENHAMDKVGLIEDVQPEQQECALSDEESDNEENNNEDDEQKHDKEVITQEAVNVTLEE